MRLQETELLNIRGGAFGLRYAILGGIAGIITFLIGVLDGYTNPQRCNND